MIRYILLLLVASIFMISCTKSSEKNNTKTAKLEKSPHDFMFMQRAYPTGEIKSDAYSKAIQWKKEQINRSSNADVIWEFSGPNNIGGRITDIEIPIDQAETYYVGAASGGIFKTIDGGANWAPIFDEQEMLSIGDMEISKNNTDVIWVGTGEVNAGGGSLAYDGNGMFKTADGGITWESKGLPNVGSIGKVLIDPNDDETIFAAAMGPLFRNDTERGVYRSTNDGDTWEQVLFVSDSTGIIDMSIHPTNGDILYAASWERIRRPNRRQYFGETSRIYRSVDGGDTWNELTNGLPTTSTNKGRISIDISASNPNVLYASFSGYSGISGVYKTIDGGDSWTEVNSSDISSASYEWWFGGLFVDPENEDIIYYLGFFNYKSTDGGSSWDQIFVDVHVDQHALAFNPMVTGEVLLGNDGGLYYSNDDGTTHVKDLNLPITQFYRFYVDPQNANKVYGGAQDNNTIRTTTGGLNDWQSIYGGDGFQPLVDPTNTNVIYALSQNGNMGKSIDDAASFENLGSHGSRNNWDTPITFDPINPQIIYYGANYLYKTTDAGDNWSIISPDLTNGGVPAGNLTFGTITSIDVSPLDSNVIYAGTDDGNVWVTQDGGSNWDLISAVLPDLWTTKVLASREDISSVYVTFSGYRYGEDNGHVFKSSDYGANWADISTDLPDIPVNDILKDSYGNLFLGTDIGVLASLDEGANWQSLGINMPSVVVNDMYIHEATEYLYVATYGRSSYKLDIADDILGNETNLFASEVKIYPNPASGFVNISTPNTTEKLELIIFDQLGKTVLIQELNASSAEERILLEGINPGVYYMQLAYESDRITKKLIVK